MTVEESPEFLRALNEACEKRYRAYLFGGEDAKAHSRDTISDTMEEMQRRRKEIEAMSEDIRRHTERVRREAKERRFRMHPHVREIDEVYRRAHGGGGLICPICGERDHGNRMNGRPYCFMNARHKVMGVDGPVPLMSPEKARDWNPPKKKARLREPWEQDEREIVRVK